MVKPVANPTASKYCEKRNGYFFQICYISIFWHIVGKLTSSLDIVFPKILMAYRAKASQWTWEKIIRAYSIIYCRVKKERRLKVEYSLAQELTIVLFCIELILKKVLPPRSRSRCRCQLWRRFFDKGIKTIRNFLSWNKPFFIQLNYSTYLVHVVRWRRSFQEESCYSSSQW